MNKPTVDEIIDGLSEHMDENDEALTRYTAVMVAAKRARQINSYYRSLGEGAGFEDLAPPLVPTTSRNYLTISMEEVARGEITYRLRTER
jgi:DNA-directed RNA polymerase subunit omega